MLTNILCECMRALRCRSVDSLLAETALEKLKRHGWYLDEPMVPLALFSELLTPGEKDKLAKKMVSVKDRDLEVRPPVFPEVGPGTEVFDLVGERSFTMFSLLHLAYDWLELPPEKWEEDADFLVAKEFVRTVKTTNDVAERGVKLISDYAAILTTDEKQRQWLLQGVEQCRKRYATCKKCTLNCTYA